MILDALEDRKYSKESRPPSERFTYFIRKVLGVAVPWRDITVDCPTSWAKSEMVEKQILIEDLYLTTGARWWTCPRCHEGACYRHMCFREQDAWW